MTLPEAKEKHMNQISWKDLRALTPEAGGPVDHQACLEAFPVLALAKTTPQDPRYHAEGDVWTHTTMVLDELVAMPDYRAASRADRELLFLAALLHDVS